MKEKAEKLVGLLTDKNKTISTMESCTGGGVANAITNIEGASEILKFSAVTYSNCYKIKMGVDKEIIDKYSVYSIEVARSMSQNISEFSHSNYGVGITGKLNKADVNNLYGKDNLVYISIYDKDNNRFYDYDLVVGQASREENKNVVIDFVIEKMLEIL